MISRKKFAWQWTFCFSTVWKLLKFFLTLSQCGKVRQNAITLKKIREITSLVKALIWRKNCWFFPKNRDRVLQYFSTLHVLWLFLSKNFVKATIMYTKEWISRNFGESKFRAFLLCYCVVQCVKIRNELSSFLVLEVILRNISLVKVNFSVFHTVWSIQFRENQRLNVMNLNINVFTSLQCTA